MEVDPTESLQEAGEQHIPEAIPLMASSQAKIQNIREDTLLSLPMDTWVDRVCNETQVSREEALYHLEGFKWNWGAAMEACRSKTLPEQPSQLDNKLISPFFNEGFSQEDVSAAMAMSLMENRGLPLSSMVSPSQSQFQASLGSQDQGYCKEGEIGSWNNAYLTETERSLEEAGEVPVPGIASSQHVPTDVVETVLLKVPFKALMRFKSACKAWRSIMNWRKFIYSHTNSSKPLFLHTRGASLWMLELETPTLVEVLSFPDRTFTSVSHCDGLVICTTYSRNPPKTRVMVFNPNQIQFIRWIERAQFSCFDKYILGRNQARVYKILRFCLGSRDQLVQVYKREAEIYDMQLDHWSSVKIDQGWLLYGTQFVSLDGTAYWLAKSKSNGHILLQSFDFQAEEFRAIAVPADFEEEEESGTMALSSLRDEQLLLLKQRSSMLTEIWSRNMEQKSGQWTWKIMFRFTGNQPAFRFASFFLHRDAVAVLAEEGTNGVLLKLTELGEGMVKQTTGIDRYPHPYYSNICAYRRSLVPLPVEKPKKRGEEKSREE